MLGMTYVKLNDLPLMGKDSWFDLQHQESPRGKVEMKLLVDLKRVSKLVAFVLIVAFHSIASYFGASPTVYRMELLRM